MPDEQVIDPETMPLEELRQKTQEAMDQPRDEQGRFTKAEAEPPVEEIKVEEEVAEEEPIVIVRREVDLGDGSGIQIFKGTGKTQLEAVEDLNDKLIEAQRNATKKIREQESRLREQQAAKTQTTADEDYVLNQKYKENPAQAIRDALDAERKRVKAEQDALAARQQRELQVQTDFVASHPDYVVNPANGNRMLAWVQTHGYPEFTEENLEKAFNDLSASGLLELKTEEADGATDGKGAETERIARPATETAQPRGRRSSTVRSGSAPTSRTELSEAELYSMPMDQLAAKTREAFTTRQE